LAALELRHCPRYLRFMHVRVRAYGFPGHFSVLAKSDQHTPFRYADTVAAIYSRECLGHKAGEHIEAMGQELVELELAAARLGVLALQNGFHDQRVPSAERMLARHWRKIMRNATADAATHADEKPISGMKRRASAGTRS